MDTIKRRSEDDTTKVFYARCPLNITEHHLYDHYTNLGPDAIKDIKWGQGRADLGSQFKGWAILTFKSTGLAMQAAAMKPPLVHGHELVVRWMGYQPLDTKRPSQLLFEMRKKRDALDEELGQQKGAGAWKKDWLQGKTLPPIEWTDEQLAARQFERDFYAMCVKTAERPADDVQNWIKQNAISVPAGCPPPIMEFSEVDFGEEVNKVLRKKYRSPFPIQSISWPILLQGRDCIGIAQTGSGKTLAYALPAIVHINAQPRAKAEEGPVVLVLAPTRELIIQICDELAKYQMAGGIRIGLAYGGSDGAADRMTQANVLMRGVDIVGGTPGRLCDFVEAKVLPLSRVSFLVIDEADALLEMGFIDQTSALVMQTRPDRQTVMFSATWVRDIHQMAESVLTDPIKVVVGSNKEKAVEANRDVEQRIVIVDCMKDKLELLVTTIQQLKQRSPASHRTLVFVGQKKFVAPVSKHLLPRYGKNVYTITGDLHQTVRENIIRRFRDDPRGILVATDLVARGLDIKDLRCVVNFQLPRDIDQYVHRIGRTGRAGEKGIAVSFFCRFSPMDCRLTQDVIDCIRRAGQQPPEELLQYIDGVTADGQKGRRKKRRVEASKAERAAPEGEEGEEEDDRWGPDNPTERLQPSVGRNAAANPPAASAPVPPRAPGLIGNPEGIEGSGGGWVRPTKAPAKSASNPTKSPFLNVRRFQSTPR
eukprot:GGOE01014535.1.p1 GENE.GGOE01014535.1~~GGOE01014535.1.p1  ORF type:complete len:805 (-),score=217.19 GGOE01014535.1:113-2230(-)